MSIRMSILAPSAAAAAGLAIIASAALAGCGQVRASGGAPAAPASQRRAGQSHAGQSRAPFALRSLCADPAAVTSVQVTRTASISQLGQAKPVPRATPRITVSDPAKARGLARAVCVLPAMPRGALSCPASFGGGYQLIFVASGRRLHAVSVEATGCESVTGTGAGQTRWAARTPGFWAELARLTGIRAPVHSP